MSYGIDRLIPSIEVASGANAVVFDEGAGDVVVSISAGLYWAHRDSTLDGLGYTSLYLAIEAALNASGSLSNTYTLRAATPAESNLQTSGGLEIDSDGVSSFSVVCDSASWTLPVGLLGDVDNAIASKSEHASASDRVIMPYCRGGEWILYNMFSETTRSADDKRSHDSYMTFESDPDPRFAYSYDWSHSDDGDQYRMYEVDRIPAAHILASRALDYAYCNTGELAYGDENNAFVDIVWENSRVLEGETTKRGDIIVVHNDVSDLAVATHDYDIVRLDKRAQRASWMKSGLLTMLTRKGEYYKLNADFRIISKNYSH